MSKYTYTDVELARIDGRNSALDGVLDEISCKLAAIQNQPLDEQGRAYGLDDGTFDFGRIRALEALRDFVEYEKTQNKFQEREW